MENYNNDFKIDDCYKQYNAVVEFNTAFEVKTIQRDEFAKILETDSKLVEYRYSLIKEEVNELTEAFYNDDKKEILDALADILYVAYGFLHVLSIDINNIDDYNNYNEQLLSGELIPTDKQIADIITYFDISDYLQDVSRLLNNSINNKLVDTVINLVFRIIKGAYIIAIHEKMDLNKAFDIVHESNMSKICSSEEEAAETVEWYKQIPKDSDKYYDSPAYRQAKIPGKWIVYNESTSKILKNINYKPADFSSIL